MSSTATCEVKLRTHCGRMCGCSPLSHECNSRTGTARRSGSGSGSRGGSSGRGRVSGSGLLAYVFCLPMWFACLDGSSIASGSIIGGSIIAFFCNGYSEQLELV